MPHKDRPAGPEAATGTFVRLIHDRRGVSAIVAGLSLSALVGFAGLGTEVGGWYFSKRAMQGAADAAALSAANAEEAGATLSQLQAEGKAIAAQYGFADQQNGVTVTINNPPTSGNYAGNTSAVEVIVSQPRGLVLASLFMNKAPTIGARAVALIGAKGTGCVLALDRSDVTDMANNGSTIVNLNNCDLYINSPSSNALTLVGQATINAYAAFISGGYSTSGDGALNTIDGTKLNANPIDDPYADVPLPSYSGCAQNNYTVKQKSVTLSPGVYCNGMSIGAQANVTLSPGVYVVDRGSFSVASGATVTGNGVTIVLTSSSGNNYATASINGGATLNITAPTSGDTAGLAFYQDRNAPSSGSNSFAGGTTQNITGALYFPDQAVTFSGGTTTGGATCTQIVAYTITFNGNAAMNNNCAGTGTRGIGTTLTKLVE